MKIIFLDFDGVLCTQRSHLAYDGIGLMQHLDPVAVKMVYRLCVESTAKIVVSSTWRHYHERTSLAAILQNAGMPIPDFHEHWQTPTKMSTTRGQEIWMWLREHPEVTSYVILDDDTDMMTEQLPHFVRTDALNGFLYEHYCDAKKILNAELGVG